MGHSSVPELIPYDEFGLFHENAAEYGIPYSGPPDVRASTSRWARAAPCPACSGGRPGRPSWCWSTAARRTRTPGTPSPWRSGRPLLAIDLPGHGHSDGGPEGSVSAVSNGRDLAAVVAELAPEAAAWSGCRSAACRRWRWPPMPPSSCARSCWSTSRRA